MTCPGEKKRSRMKKRKNKILIFIEKNILKIVYFFILLFVFYLIFILYRLQIIQGESYNEEVLARANRVQNAEIQRRGSIFFQNNNGEKVAVAIQDYAYTVAINPKNIKNPLKLYDGIKDILKIDKKSFLKKATKKDDPYEEIALRVSEDKIKKLKERNLPLIYKKISLRKYPFNELSSKIIGFLNFEGRGVYGLERYYDNILSRSGEKGEEKILNLFFDSDKKSLFRKKLISKEGDLLTSIDIGLSGRAEKVVKEINKKYHSKYTGIIILKPATGEILAMTDSESFDLNKEKKDYRNQLVEYRFEVGSIFKPLVVAIGLQSKKINQNFSYNDRGCVQINNQRICNYDKKGRGPNTNLEKIISESLNTGMIEIEKRIGHRLFLEYLLKLRLSEETGIDLPGEISPSLSNLNEINDVDYATATFGQGISFTPIAITRALSAIANDGYIVKPHIVKKVEYGGLIPDSDFQIERERVFSPHTVKVIKDLMIKRADKYAYGKDYYNKNFAVASKTGTAQIASSKGGYLEGKNIHTYFGFFPARAAAEERYAIFLYTVEPQGVKYSSQTLTEPFYKIVNFMIPYFDIQPDRPRIKI